MISSLLTLIGGWKIKLAGVLAGLLVISCLYIAMNHYRVAYKEQSVALAQQKEQVATYQEDFAKYTIATTQVTNDLAVGSAQVVVVKEAVNATPVTQSCVSSPAIRALLNGLHADPSGSSSTSAHPK